MSSTAYNITFSQALLYLKLWVTKEGTVESNFTIVDYTIVDTDALTDSASADKKLRFYRATDIDKALLLPDGDVIGLGDELFHKGNAATYFDYLARSIEQSNQSGSLHHSARASCHLVEDDISLAIAEFRNAVCTGSLGLARELNLRVSNAINFCDSLRKS